jgi:glucose-6-phosphate-specific signal transduction histidine kinase
MILDVFVVSLVFSLFFKRRIFHLHETNIKLIYLFPLPFVLQFLPISNRILMMVVSYSLLFFLLSINHHVEGFKLIMLGSALNFLAILLGGGRMPVYGPLANKMGLLPSIKHALLEKFTPILLIGDVIPAYTPWGRKFLISIGDVLVYVGLLIFMLSKPYRSSFERTL